MGETNRCVVKLTTTVWRDQRGINIQRSLVYLRRQCVGFNILEEDCSATYPREVVERVTNLDQCVDGTYEVVTCNESRDWETGYIEDYDYRLIPYEIKEA